MYKYESKLKDVGKKEYPLLMSDPVDEMEEIAIKRKGEKEIKAKIDRIRMDALTNTLSSLERIDFIFHRLK